MRSISTPISITLMGALCLVSAASAQKTTGPKAQYEMDVSTMSGIGAGFGGGLSAIMGGGGGANHMLDLRLTSNQAVTTQQESGEHFFQPSAKMGKSVPLLGDVPGKVEDRPDKPFNTDRPMEKPKGRILMFWGCNANAPKGQPFIIDFAKMPTAKMPPMGFPGREIPGAGMARGRNDGKNAAWWPNGKNGKPPKSDSSVIGEHRITSNFTPEIKFALANNFMGALNPNAGDAGAAINLNWNSVSSATGYVAWAFGGMVRAGSGGVMVMWTSANSREFSVGMDWLSPAEAQRQIAQKMVMPPSQTTCSIPAEAKTAAGGALFGTLNAFGPEENFAFPPKPADPKAVWNIEWTSKARFRSSATFFTGAGMGGMRGMDGGDSPTPAKKKSCKGPFGVPIPGTQC